MKPYHEHPLLANYSSHIGPTFMRADWYCNHCGEEIKGPPFEVGEYVVTHVPIWRVWMKATFWLPNRAPVFETTRKREALKHARQLERERLAIAQVAAGDPVAVAENAKIVAQLKQKESES